MESSMPAYDAALIEVKNLSFQRGDRVIYDGIDMHIARGKITAIMGPSGTGKTTLLSLIDSQLLQLLYPHLPHLHLNSLC